MLPLQPFGNPLEVMNNKRVDFSKLNGNLQIYEGRCFDLELAKQIKFITQDLKPSSYQKEVKKFVEDCIQIGACSKVNSLTVWTIVNSSELIWYPFYRCYSQKSSTFTFDSFISFVKRFISAVFILYELEILTDDPYLPQSYAKILASGLQLALFMPANAKESSAFWNTEKFMSSKFYTPLLSFFSRRLPGRKWKGDQSGYDERVTENLMAKWAANGGIRYEQDRSFEPLLRAYCLKGKEGFSLQFKACPNAMSNLKSKIFKILETKGEIPRMLPALGIVSNHSAKIARVIDCLFIKAYPKRNQLGNGKYCTCLWDKCSCKGFGCRCPMKIRRKFNAKKETPRPPKSITTRSAKTYDKNKSNRTTAISKGNIKKATNTVRKFSATPTPQANNFRKILTENEWVQRYSQPAIIRPLSVSSDDDTSVTAVSQRTTSDARNSLYNGDILRVHSADDNKYVFNIDRAHLDMRNITLNCDQHRNHPNDMEGPTRGEETDTDSEDGSDPDKKEVQNTFYNDREVYDVGYNGYGDGYGCGKNPNKDDPGHGNQGLRNYGNGCHDNYSCNDLTHGNQVENGHYPYDDGFTYDEYGQTHEGYGNRFTEQSGINDNFYDHNRYSIAEDGYHDEHGTEDQHEFTHQGRNTYDYDVDANHNETHDSHDSQDEFCDRDEDYFDNQNGYTHDNTDSDNSINNDQDNGGSNVEDDQGPQNQDSDNDDHHPYDSYNSDPYEENNGDYRINSDHDSYNSSDF